MAGNGYYVLWEFPKELKTDEQYTYKITTYGDVTDVTYSFGWKFVCNGVATEKTIASGLTSTTYTWTPTSVTFGPLMKSSTSGTLSIVVKSSNGEAIYIQSFPLTIANSVRPSITQCVAFPLEYDFSGMALSNWTHIRVGVTVKGVYGATQKVTATVGDAVYSTDVEAKPGPQTTAVDFDIGTLDIGSADSATKTINVQVTDSRGFSTTGTASIPIYKYVKPTLTASVSRNDEEVPVLNFAVTYQKTVAGKTNSITNFFVRNIDGENQTDIDLVNKTSPQTLTRSDDVGPYELSKSYSFTVMFRDSVSNLVFKRLILPSDIPVMDIGADGKTVTFFGTSPQSATKDTLKISDVASFGDEVVLGKTNGRHTILNSGGLQAMTGNTTFVHIGYGQYSNGTFIPEEGLNGSDEYTLPVPFCAFGTRDPNYAVGEYSLSNGENVVANRSCSFASGLGVCATGNNQVVFGKYNKKDSTYAMIIGNGASDTGRSNALAIDWNGTICGEDINMEAAGSSFRPYYKKGDTITFDRLATAGFLTNANKNVYFTVPLDKPIIGSPTVTAASNKGFIFRQRNSSEGGSYTHGSSASAYVTPTSYTAQIKGSWICITAVFSTTTNSVNNTPIGIDWSGKITFS